MTSKRSEFCEVLWWLVKSCWLYYLAGTIIWRLFIQWLVANAILVLSSYLLFGIVNHAKLSLSLALTCTCTLFTDIDFSRMHIQSSMPSAFICCVIFGFFFTYGYRFLVTVLIYALMTVISILCLQCMPIY